MHVENLSFSMKTLKFFESHIDRLKSKNMIALKDKSWCVFI